MIGSRIAGEKHLGQPTTREVPPSQIASLRGRIL